MIINQRLSIELSKEDIVKACAQYIISNGVTVPLTELESVLDVSMNDKGDLIATVDIVPPSTTPSSMKYERQLLQETTEKASVPLNSQESTLKSENSLDTTPIVEEHSKTIDTTQERGKLNSDSDNAELGNISSSATLLLNSNNEQEVAELTSEEQVSMETQTLGQQVTPKSSLFTSHK